MFIIVSFVNHNKFSKHYLDRSITYTQSQHNFCLHGFTIDKVESCLTKKIFLSWLHCCKSSEKPKTNLKYIYHQFLLFNFLISLKEPILLNYKPKSKRKTLYLFHVNSYSGTFHDLFISREVCSCDSLCNCYLIPF